MLQMGAKKTAIQTVNKRRFRRSRNNSSPDESVAKDLPDELVAKIIAMMPFPAIFKARTLSKTWLARLSPIKPLDDRKEQKRRATRAQARKSVMTSLRKDVAAFQREVSANWPILFPCRLSWLESVSCGYELASHTFRRLPSLSFLPKSMWENCQVVNTTGALLLLNHISSFAKPQKLYIVNIFTRSWKLLPPCPHLKEVHGDYLLHRPNVINQSIQDYKVVVLFKERTGRDINGDCYIKTYDSKSNAWSSKKLDRTIPVYGGWCVVHLNGVLYWTSGKTTLFAIDCEEGIVTELPLSGHLDGTQFVSGELVVCNSSLVMVLTVVVNNALTHKLMKIDVESGRLWEIGIGSPHLKRRGLSSETPVGHGDSMYISFLGSCGGGLTYNIPKDEWSHWDVSPRLSYSFWDNHWIWKPSLVEPGLNLFMPV